MNGVHVSEVSNFLAEMSEITHAIELVNPFDAAHPLIILFQLSSITSYFEVYSPSVTEYENKNIQKIHLNAEEPTWSPSPSEYLERETQMINH